MPLICLKAQTKRIFLETKHKFLPLWKSALNKSRSECATLSIVATGGAFPRSGADARRETSREGET